MILGDFNSDLDKPGFRKEKLVTLMRKHSLISLDKHFKQEIEYTYLKKGSNNYNFSWIDHVLARKFSMFDECKIVSSDINKSDHNAIISALTLSCSNDYRSTHSAPETPLPVIDWNDIE